MCAAAVRERDRPDDREPEPRAATSPRRVRAREAIERALEEAGREAGAAVADVELDRAVGGGRGELDPTASVPKGVVDQVPERLLEAEAVAPEPQVAGLRGGDGTVPGLRALWRGLLKSRSNAPLTALRPIIVIKEGSNGLGMQLRLVAGPLNDAGAAAKICAVLTENKRNCETAIFDGQRLSVTGEDPAPPPAASKPSSRRHGAMKRAAAVVVEEPPKKPETSTTAAISSWFGKRGQ